MRIGSKVLKVHLLLRQSALRDKPQTVDIILERFYHAQPIVKVTAHRKIGESVTRETHLHDECFPWQNLPLF